MTMQWELEHSSNNDTYRYCYRSSLSNPQLRLTMTYAKLH